MLTFCETINHINVHPKRLDTNILYTYNSLIISAAAAVKPLKDFGFAIFDHFYHFGKIWTIVDHFWPFQPFLPFWLILAHFGPFWPILTNLTIFHNFDHFWPFWTILTTFDYFWPFWTILDHVSPFSPFFIIWTNLGQFDHFWQLFTIVDIFLFFFSFYFLIQIFRSFWHQRIYDTTLGSWDIGGVPYSSSWILYAILILQLVLNYEQELYSTGNQDLCFYNFQCARPVSKFCVEKSDFNFSVR